MNLVETVSNTPGAWTVRARSAETSWEAALWSERGQKVRFETALRHLKLEACHSLLDYGCGTGALSELVPEGCEYVGVDFSPGMLQRARREHPGREFHSTVPERMFSHVAAIGVWNLASMDEAELAILYLWGRCNERLVASIHRDLCPPRELAERFEAYGSMLRVLVDTAYYPNDAMLILRR